MALVSNIHQKADGDDKNIITDLMIWRDGKEHICQLQLRHIHGETYEVVGSGNEAIRIFGQNERVLLKPIANQRFTHLIMQ